MTMKVALGQFAVSREWQDNADICIGLMAQAEQQGARLLVLPEGCWRVILPTRTWC
ncbi:hypothetical protein ERHA54_12750 [Erwinia rhapontici]|nr:hypothetical protein ERHA54_12750 [Erwinia rhapontici]